MMKYFVQTKYDDGEIGGSMNTAPQIIEMFGFRDCTDCEYQVYDVSEFGKVVELLHIPAISAPFNYHTFVSSRTGEVIFEGYSQEH